jgi:hypothetical protein
MSKAFTNSVESQLLNVTLRTGCLVQTGTGLSYSTGTTTYTTGTSNPLYLAFLTNSTDDTSITELAAGGSYTGAGRPAFVGTAGQQFSTSAGTNVASTAGAALVNANALTFTATATHTGIVGIAICTSQTVGSSLDTTAIYYGDLTGGSVTLTAGQSITFAAGAISVTLN